LWIHLKPRQFSIMHAAWLTSVMTFVPRKRACCLRLNVLRAVRIAAHVSGRFTLCMLAATVNQCAPSNKLAYSTRATLPSCLTTHMPRLALHKRNLGSVCLRACVSTSQATPTMFCCILCRNLVSSRAPSRI